MFSAPTTQVALMVARLDSIQAPPPMQAAVMIAQGQQPLSKQLFEDMGLLMRNEASAKIKPTSDIARARAALGLSPDVAPPAASGAPAKGTPAS